MVMQWGQFLDHDISLGMESISRQTFDDGITCSATCENNPPCFPIDITENDPRYNHFSNVKKYSFTLKIILFNLLKVEQK